MLEGLLAFVTAHPFVSIAVLMALVFDFVNGFHDSANAIATVVATKVLTPAQAIAMAGVFNFVGPFVFTLAVASTIGKGIVLAKFVTPTLVFAALLGAITWNMITWYFGLPSSSSHALVGGLIGAGLAAVGPNAVLLPTWAEALGIGQYAIYGLIGGAAGALIAFVVSRVKLPRSLFAPFGVVGAVGVAALFVVKNPLHAFDAKKILEFGLNVFSMALMGAVAGATLWVATQRKMSMNLIPGFALFGMAVSLVVATLLGKIVLGGITKTLLFMIVSPFLGFFAGFLLASVVAWFALGRDPAKVSKGSKRAQLFSSAFYALTHGTNDAQKTMGIIAVLLITVEPAGTAFSVPTWVIIASASAMGFGTLFGGWRIVQTMASRITHLTPAQGFAAETGGGVVLVAMAAAGAPVSTTHAISASIMGVGATRRMSAVRWGVGRRIVGAWILTIPAAAIVAFATYYLVRAIVGA